MGQFPVASSSFAFFVSLSMPGFSTTECSLIASSPPVEAATLVSEARTTAEYRRDKVETALASPEAAGRGQGNRISE
jgi:hypothetical protein